MKFRRSGEMTTCHWRMAIGCSTTAQILARFEAERQALALMDHPHITRVYDAGETDDGRPFIAMELIEDGSIDRFTRDRGASTKLILFTKFCRAAAHQRGVIHRDLKPSNLLIDCTDPAHPQPKVIDFREAKALDAPLTEPRCSRRSGSWWRLRTT